MAKRRRKAAPKPAAAPAPPAAPAKTFADYGFVATFLNAHPDVKDKVALAVAGGWQPQRLEAEIKTTGWWTSRSDAQRKYDLMAAENPTELQRAKDQKKAELQALVPQMGLSWSEADYNHWADQFTANGSSEQEIRATLGGMFKLGKSNTGQAGIAVDQIAEMGADFGVVLADADVERWTRQVMSGAMTVEGLTDLVREQAKVLYPPIADQLDKGLTVRDFLTPYMGIAAKELGVPTESMSTVDPKWTKALTGPSGQPMNSDEWTRLIRTDAKYKWDETAGAKNKAAGLATELSRMMGGIG